MKTEVGKTENGIKIIVLELLEELMKGAEFSETDPTDWSGCHTKWIMNSEQFRANIREKIEELNGGKS